MGIRKNNIQIVERLRTALKKGGFTFKEAALRAGIPEKTLQKWVQGAALPRIDQFAKLIPLGVNPIYILTGEGPPLLPREDKDVLAYTGKKNFPGRRKSIY